MSHDKFKSQVEGIEKLANDASAVADLGKRVVQQIAAAVAEERRGLQISNPDLEFTIAKGQPVPAQFLDRVKVDAAGLAVADTVVQYLKIIVWLRIWVRIIIVFGPILEANSMLNRFQEFSDKLNLGPDETALLNRLDKIAG